MSLGDRLEALGQRLAEREAAHGEALAHARQVAERLHALVEPALGRYHAALARVGVQHLDVTLSPPRADDKHAHSVQFDLARGRHAAIVTVKDRGEVTLVGPFRSGKTEGPCRTFPIEASDEIDAALADFLERFLEEAATP